MMRANMVRIIQVILFAAKIHSLQCFVNWEFGYPASYSAHWSKAYSTHQNCAKDCYTRKRDVERKVIFATVQGANCYCSTENGGTISASYQHVYFNFDPFMISEDALEVSSSYEPMISQRIYVRGNDLSTIHGFESLSKPLEESKYAVISSTTPITAVNPVKVLNYKRHDVTRTESKYVLTPDPGEGFLHPHAISNIKISDNDDAASSTLYFATIQSNDRMISVDITKPITITRSNPLRCNITFNESTSYVDPSTSEFVVTIALTTDDNCNKNMKDLTIMLSNEAYVEPEVNTTPHPYCMTPTSMMRSHNQVNVFYSKLYIFSYICVTVRYKGSSKSIGDAAGSKLMTVHSLFAYTTYSNGAEVKEKVQKTYKTFISNNVRGYYIQDSESGLCLKSEPDGNLVLTEHPHCTYFKEIPYNLMTTHGLCIDKGPSAINSENCKREMRMKFLNGKFQFLSDDTYFTVPKASALNTEVTASTGSVFHKISGSFGIKGAANNRAVTKNPELHDVTILYVDESFVACNYNSDREYRCIRYTIAEKKVWNFPPQFANILGYDSTKKRYYGKTKTGGFIMVQEDKKHSIYHIRQATWENIRNGSTTTKANVYSRSDLATAKVSSAFSAPSSFSVTYLGLYDDSSYTHVILWFAAEDCASTVGTNADNALNNCAETKKYCKSTRSRVYYMSTLTNPPTHGQVYCDMETDENGWMLVSNYTVLNREFPPLTMTSDIFAVVSSGFAMHIKPSGLQTVWTGMGFSKVRLYCSIDKPAKTVHLRTLNTNTDSVRLIDWLKGSSAVSSQAAACTTYETYPDNTAFATGMCGQWDGGRGFWGSPSTQDTSLYDNTFYTPQHSWRVGPTTSSCDTGGGSETLFQDGTWQIYVA